MATYNISLITITLEGENIEADSPQKAVEYFLDNSGTLVPNRARELESSDLSQGRRRFRVSFTDASERAIQDLRRTNPGQAAINCPRSLDLVVLEVKET